MQGIQRYGGQGGCAASLANQSSDLSNSEQSQIEKIEEIASTANRLQTAAMWLHQHRESLTRPVIPALRERFKLSNLEAIEAAKQAHGLAYPGA
jgi:hypothetical protein